MDNTDRTIVTALQADARLSYRELGRASGLSPNAAAERVRRLAEAGTIRFHTKVNHAAMGRRLAAYIDLRMRPGVRADDFERDLRKLDGILSATLTTGRYDYTLYVACVDEAALVAIVETLRDECGAQETYSRVVLREVEFA